MIKLRRSCRDVTRLVLEGQDRSLSLGERIGLRMHMWMCAACPGFERQVQLMRGAMGRWRAYANEDEAPR